MPTITLSPPSTRPTTDISSNPLPNLLQTPSGLAIIEMQGTINLPQNALDRIDADLEAGGHSDTKAQFETSIGRLIFPDYHPGETPADDKSWMKRVYLYVGQNQRMTGEVKAIPKPLAVLRRRQADKSMDDGDEDGDVQMNEKSEKDADELEIVDIIKYRIYFKLRPEPVSNAPTTLN